MLCRKSYKNLSSISIPIRIGPLHFIQVPHAYVLTGKPDCSLIMISSIFSIISTSLDASYGPTEKMLNPRDWQQYGHSPSIKSILNPRRINMEKSICNAMDEFYRLVNSLPPTEASDALSRFAATKLIEVSIQALSRLYVLTFIQVKYHQDFERSIPND